jgi:transposase-like protein
LRDAAAAQRLLRKAPIHRIRNPASSTPIRPRLYCSAIASVKEAGTLRRCCRHRPVQYLNNILEQDHRAIKRRVKFKLSFRDFFGVLCR